MSAHRHPPSAIRHPRRLLVRGVNWLGDAVMTTPALLRLREALPETHITLLTPDKLADLWTGHAAVDAVLAFGAQENVWRVSRRLAAERFDCALVLPNSPRSALEVALARIPRRVGYGGGGRGWLLTHAVAQRPGAVAMRKRPVAEIQRLVAEADRSALSSGAAVPAASALPATRGQTTGSPGETPGGPRQAGTPAPLLSAASHHIHHYLHLAATLGASAEPLAPRLDVSAEETRVARVKFGLGEDTHWLGLNAGAEYGPAKRWPRERFIVTAVELHRRTQCRWLLFGGGADQELAAGIATEIRHALPGAPAGVVVNVAGRTSLRELCALLKACRVLVTNDTGPMHVAAAVGTPVVVPFGSTSAALTGPGLPGDARHQLLSSGAPCAPCFLRECPIDFRCLNGIDTERVLEAVMSAAKRRSLHGP